VPPRDLFTAQDTLAHLKSSDRKPLIKHEASQWLDDLIRDAKHEKAPQELRGHAAIVRQYLGIGTDDPLTREHCTRFASRFEQCIKHGSEQSNGQYLR
jgi:hypothetical protein